MEQHASAAHAFFQAHKDLFQYETYVGKQDPFLIEYNPDQVQNGAAKSFVEQYREIDREPLSVPALSELRFTMLHPPTRRFSIPNLTVHTTAAPLPGFVTLQSTASILEKLNNPQHQPIPTQTSANPLQYTSQQHTQHTLPQPALRVTHDSTSTPPHLSPDRASVSSTTVDRSLLLQQQRSPVRVSVESKQGIFILPKLAELLIDREARAASTAHKPWDAAHKIEILVGHKCVGRVSAASRNIPPSIRYRLGASGNVSVRRERLYDLLRRDYEELSKRYTQ